MSSLKRTLDTVMTFQIEWKRLEGPLPFERLSRRPEENHFGLLHGVCNEYNTFPTIVSHSTRQWLFRQFVKYLDPPMNFSHRANSGGYIALQTGGTSLMGRKSPINRRATI
jgi:hypothetical protein